MTQEFVIEELRKRVVGEAMNGKSSYERLLVIASEWIIDLDSAISLCNIERLQNMNDIGIGGLSGEVKDE